VPRKLLKNNNTYKIILKIYFPKSFPKTIQHKQNYRRMKIIYDILEKIIRIFVFYNKLFLSQQIINFLLW